MTLREHIDFQSIFEKAKKNQLEEYPTAEKYIDDLVDWSEPANYVLELYNVLHSMPEYDEIDLDFADYDLVDLEKGEVTICFIIGGNNATENGNDYWGYEYVFTVNLEDELFVGYKMINHS